MKQCGESLIDVKPVRNWKAFSNVPITKRDGVWYLHVLPTHEDNIVLGDVPKPKQLRMLNHDVAITWFAYNENIRELTANVSMTMRSDLNNVIAVYWETEPEK